MKTCRKCGELKPLAEFYKSKKLSDGFYNRCKTCAILITAAWKKSHPEEARAATRKWRKANPGKHNAKNCRRNAAKLRAAPKWSEADLIKVVYERAGAMGFEVDHVVPLLSKAVCGLHVWSNLQLLSKPENRKKSNYVWPDMWEQLA